MKGFCARFENVLRSCGCLMSGALSAPVMRRFDGAVDRMFIPLRRNRVANRVFYAASEAGNHSLIWHALNLAQSVSSRNARRGVAIAVALGVESALVNGPVKMLFRRDRPVHEGERPHRLRTPRTSSFPSGHATSAFCAAALLTTGAPRLRVVYYVTAATVAISRVHVRIHHATDVVGGAMLGATFGALARRVVRTFNS